MFSIYLLNAKSVHHKENMLYKEESPGKIPDFSFISTLP